MRLSAVPPLTRFTQLGYYCNMLQGKVGASSSHPRKKRFFSLVATRRKSYAIVGEVLLDFRRTFLLDSQTRFRYFIL